MSGESNQTTRQSRILELLGQAQAFAKSASQTFNEARSATNALETHRLEVARLKTQGRTALRAQAATILQTAEMTERAAKEYASETQRHALAAAQAAALASEDATESGRQRARIEAHRVVNQWRIAEMQAMELHQQASAKLREAIEALPIARSRQESAHSSWNQLQQELQLKQNEAARLESKAATLRDTAKPTEFYQLRLAAQEAALLANNASDAARAAHNNANAMRAEVVRLENLPIAECALISLSGKLVYLTGRANEAQLQARAAEDRETQAGCRIKGEKKGAWRQRKKEAAEEAAKLQTVAHNLTKQVSRVRETLTAIRTWTTKNHTDGIDEITDQGREGLIQHTARAGCKHAERVANQAVEYAAKLATEAERLHQVARDARTMVDEYPDADASPIRQLEREAAVYDSQAARVRAEMDLQKPLLNRKWEDAYSTQRAVQVVEDQHSKAKRELQDAETRIKVAKKELSSAIERAQAEDTLPVEDASTYAREAQSAASKVERLAREVKGLTQRATLAANWIAAELR